jgi:two-component system, chemotaxis family, chemotaxis protein CheY
MNGMANLLKVLVCDDSILIRKRLKESIQSCCASAVIVEAKDGQMAVDMYVEHKPDLIFMDIVMPVKGGIEAVKEIKLINPDVKVVMASSTGTQANLRKAIEAGAYEFIQKPWEQSTIESIMGKLLSERA